MNATEAVNKALPIFLQHGSFEDEELLEVFLKNNFAPDTARKIIVFMPIAFGRLIMRELKIDTFDEFEVVEIVNNSLHKQIRKLNDVGIFREAFKLACSISVEKVRKEEFWSVAGRSAEVRVVNQMELKGSNPRDLVLTRPATMWEIEEEPPHDVTESTQTNVKESSEKKWWEFWK